VGRVGYGQYCPITRAAEVLGERWTIPIVRDLICGTTRFNDLARGMPGLSRSLLAKRLRQLELAGVVERADGEYHLTPAGRDLHDVIWALGEWGARWQFDEPREEELDPDLLMWWVHDRLDFDVLPDRRIVLAFDFQGIRQRFWIVKDAAGPGVCKADPGFEVDVVLRSRLSTLYEVWVGRRDLGLTLERGDIELEGRRELVRAMPQVMQLSPVAPLVAATR
jgi:DNA-binding HxlR family transcriptional regulator